MSEAEAGRGPWRLLARGTAFRRLWAGQAASVLGDRVSGLALPLAAVLVLHAGAAAMGMLTAANLLPFLVLSLPVGAWVDRRGRRRELMMWADVARLALTLSIPVAFVTHRLSLAQLWAVAALLGVAQVVFDLSYPGVLAATVPEADYTDASTLLQGSRAASRLLGPSATGWLVQAVSAPLALVADAASFAASAWSLARLPIQEPAGVPAAPGDFTRALRLIWAPGWLRRILLALSTVNFFNYMFATLFILYAAGHLHVPPARLGLILAVGAVGAGLGALAAGPLVRRWGFPRALLCGVALFTVPLVLVPIASGAAAAVEGWLALAELGSGFGVMVLDVSFGSWSLALVPGHLRGRAAGAFSQVNYGIRPLGALAGGFLPALVGVHSTLWVAAVGACAGGAWLWPALRRRAAAPVRGEAAG